MENTKKNSKDYDLNNSILLPVLPLRDMIVFPGIVQPLGVGRLKSRAAIEEAAEHHNKIILIAQKNSAVEDPTIDDLHTIGVMADILQILHLPDDTIRLTVEAVERIKIDNVLESDPFFTAIATFLPATSDASANEITASMRMCTELFDKVVQFNNRLPAEAIDNVKSIDSPSRYADTISSYLPFTLTQKQELLEEIVIEKRLVTLSEFLSNELEVMEIEQRLHSKVKSEMDEHQKDFYLRERLKAIREELGDCEDGGNEIGELKELAMQSGMPEKILDKTLKEIDRLSHLSPASPDTAVTKNYVDWLISMPWDKRSEDKLDLDAAEIVLNEDHFGILKAKERIIEYLAVRKLNPKMHGPILCFVGPPGVGKTSIGRSIARALGREFVRLSLGGMHDESEIRGHRRTYVGAMPGRIISGIKNAGTKNPVFMLDEIDKVGKDFRGDPSSALLEVLDPEQNFSFSDHYLDAPFDLSEIMFVTTANLLDPIPDPLRDRMEIIEFTSYTEDEKLHIARGFLLPKQLKENGLKPSNMSITDESILLLIRNYTREAGVRNLEREIGSVCRKVAKAVASGKRKSMTIKPATIKSMLGEIRYRYGSAGKLDEVGNVTGLAWTAAGGDVLNVEAQVVPGKGNLQLTGQLGEVMQESAKAAITYARAHAKDVGVEDKYFQEIDTHIHVPEGQTPKDGPSAGITLCTAYISALTKRKVHKNIAMTGEITLLGKVLPVGGIKEKVISAHRAGITDIIMPAENKKDLEEIPEHIKSALGFHFVNHVNEVLTIALR